MKKKSSFILDVELKTQVQKLLGIWNKDHAKEKKMTLTVLIESWFKMFDKDLKFRRMTLKEARS